MWHKHVLLPWYCLWIRRDEFHKSLELDGIALESMDDGERKEYLANLIKRRIIAHQREAARFDRAAARFRKTQEKIKERAVYRKEKAL
jgi:hypothetical protein